MSITIYKAPRYDGVTIGNLDSINRYIDFSKGRQNFGIYLNTTFEDWYGVNIENVASLDAVSFFALYHKEDETLYATYDFLDGDQFNKFVFRHNDYRTNNWTKEMVEELLSICKEVLNSSKLIEKESEVMRFDWFRGRNEMVKRVYIELEDVSVAKRLLPRSGFSDEYNEEYINNIKQAIDTLEKILNTVDFETEMIGVLV